MYVVVPSGHHIKFPIEKCSYSPSFRKFEQGHCPEQNINLAFKTFWRKLPKYKKKIKTVQNGISFHTATQVFILDTVLPSAIDNSSQKLKFCFLP